MSVARFFREKIVEPVRRAQGSPESVARAGAIGLWVALTPTVGAQSLIVTALAVPMRANLPISLVLCWITNPVTVIPFYFAYYWLGTMLLGFPTGSYMTIATRFQEQFGQLKELGLVDSMAPLGYEILWPMCVGSLVLATATAFPVYHGLLWYCRKRQKLGLPMLATGGVRKPLVGSTPEEASPADEPRPGEDASADEPREGPAASAAPGAEAVSRTVAGEMPGAMPGEIPSAGRREGPGGEVVEGGNRPETSL